MPFFRDPAEVEQYLGGMWARARETEAGPALAAADLDLLIRYTDPDATTLVHMRGDNVTAEHGVDWETEATVVLTLPSDLGDQYWRGELNLAVAIAKGKAKASGPVMKVLKLVPLTKPLFPIYREMIAEKDAAAPAA